MAMARCPPTVESADSGVKVTFFDPVLDRRLRVTEPAADLPVLLAVLSSFRDRPLPGDLATFGEIGLAGEIRPVPNGQERLREAAKHGFSRVIVPKANAPREDLGFLLVAAIGLSETSAETILRAHAVHPIAAVQTEYSLWTREAEIAVIDACREIGAAFVAFSPLARGFLTGALRDDYVALADEAGCTPGQLALAWLLEQGEDIIPIPGTANLAHLEENFTAGEVQVDAADLERAGALINRHTVTGDRYNPTTLAEIDTEQFP